MATESEFTAEIEEQLLETFFEHPQCSTNDDGRPIIPASALVDVFRQFSEDYDSVELMTKQEEESLTQLVEANPGLEVTPDIILQFIMQRANFISPPRPESPSDAHTIEDTDTSISARGRFARRRSRGSYSRDSSQDSDYHRSSASRPSSRGPSQSQSASALEKRQRTAPLTAPPSSWAKPPPAARRKSIDGGHSRNLSDSEGGLNTSFRFPIRRRPSNPPPPGMLTSSSDPYLPTDGFGSPGSYSRPASRTHSRAGSRASSRQGFLYSPESSYDMHSPDISTESISSVPLPISHDLDSDSDDDEEGADGETWHARAGTLSGASMDDEQRIQLLRASNDELARKLRDLEDTLQRRLAEHEDELQEMTIRLEDLKSELSSVRRDEKELRAKERTNQSQITALEAEIARITKTLDNSKISYNNLNKQYQDQCAESERYRNQLRQRDIEIKDHKDHASLAALETQKLMRERTAYEERIAALEEELNAAQQAHAQLDDQKQENLMLKETIDRMRYEMDELRTSAASGDASGGSGASSRTASLNRSLGEELARGLKGAMEMNKIDEDESFESETIVGDEGDDTEGETEIQTIITRRRKKVAGRANAIDTVHYLDSREFADAHTQYDTDIFVASSSTQTDTPPKIITASAGAQTVEAPVQAISIQTEPEPDVKPRLTAEMDIQTDEPVEVISVASSATLVSPASKGKAALLPIDLPPAYEENQSEKQLRLERKVIADSHAGLILPIKGVKDGITADTIAEWAALKAELGVGCSVIDEVVESSKKKLPASQRSEARQHRLNKFYNIYNTYVYGDKPGSTSILASVVGTILYTGATACVVLYATGQLSNPQYAIPGGASYYDRLAWSSFNGMQAAGEGFAGPDGTAVVWNLFGRLGGGAARTLRGWPT